MERKHLQLSITILLILLSVSTMLMIYLSNMEAVAFDAELYQEKFDEFGIHSKFNDSVDLSYESGFLIDYLQQGIGADNLGEIDSDFYNNREKTHLVEVRDLFGVFHTFLNVAVVVSILVMFMLLITVKRYTISMKKEYHAEYFKRLLSKLMIWTGGLVDGVAVLFGIMVLFFSGAFYKFHEIFFKTDTWMLDPGVDNLIRMFPEQFFFDMFVRIVVMSVLFGTVMLVVGFVIRLGKPEFMRKKNIKQS